MHSSSRAARIGDRRRATIAGAIVEGWRRAVRAPAVVLGLIVMTTIVALPLAAIVGRQVQLALGHSAMAGRVVQGWDVEWAGEFAAEAEGLAKTLTYEIVGFGATLQTLGQILDVNTPHASLWLPIAAYLLLWLWISGGVLDRLARGRPVGTAVFFAACGVFFWRFLRLSLVIAPLYLMMFLWLHPVLFHDLYPWWIADMTSEARAMVVRTALYLVFLLGLMVVSLISDFAKVRMVVEDRHSAIASIAAGLRFVRRRWLRVLALYAGNIMAQVVLARLWLQVAPGAQSATWIALAASQVYLVFRIWARLGFVASEIVFFQGELAHAQYAALPEVAWPDSPSVEGLRRLGHR